MGDRPPGLGGEGTGRGSQGIRAALGCWVLGGRAGNCSGEGCVRLSMAHLSLVGCWGWKRLGRPRPTLGEPNIPRANRPCSFHPSLPPVSRPRRGNLTQSRGRK